MPSEVQPLDAPAPTVMLGIGDFGREVLRRVLVHAALSEDLEWETTASGGRAERRLAGLAVFHLPEERRPEGAQAPHWRSETDLDLLRDVERQIVELPAGGGRETEVAGAIAAASRRLLQTRAPGRKPRLPGLHLLVITQPMTREAIGRLETVTQEIFTELGRLPNLRRGFPGAEPLAALAILDFDNYWDHSVFARGLRQGLRAAAERWRNQRLAAEQGFGRVFLSSGFNRQRVRPPELRLDEICLFVELLLHEAALLEDLRRVFQPQPHREELFGTFGIRLCEHNEALLCRLAAARFGVGWLKYLAGSEPASPSETEQHLRARLEPYLAEALERRLGGGEVTTALAGVLAELEMELLDLSPERADWLASVASRWEARRSTFETEVGRRVGALARDLGESLERFPAELEEGLGNALVWGHAPLPVGTAVAELEALRCRLAPPLEPARPTLAPIEPYWHRLRTLAERFQLERNSQLTPGTARALALAFALVFSTGWASFVRDFATTMPLPWAAAPLGHPLVAPLGLVTLSLALSWFALGPWLAHHDQKRARLFRDRAQGRVADAVRAGLAPDGALRAPLDQLCERLRQDLRTHAANVIDRELGRALARLNEVRREMFWLRDQLSRFLSLYGLPADGRWAEFDGPSRDETGIRRQIKPASDLAQRMRRLPAEAATFRSLQSETQVLQRWRELWSSPFLYPLEFLEPLSTRFRADAEAGGPLQTQREPEAETEILALLRQRETFDLAFDWRPGEGIPAADRFVLLPAAWRENPGLAVELQGVGIGPGRVLTPRAADRAYLLSLQTGISPEGLEEG